MLSRRIHGHLRMVKAKEQQRQVEERRSVSSGAGEDVTRARTISRLGTVALAALAALLICGFRSAEASAAVINFDNLDPPGPGGLGLVVNDDYASQGVTFNDPQAFDYSEGPGAIPGFAHSGNVAVEPCVGAELCAEPVRATFTSAQRRVGVWVGYSSPLDAPLGVRLTAYNATSGGAVVGTANATLPVSSSPTPIQRQLEVEAASATIRRLEVSVSSADPSTAGLAVDDVEFSAAGPPPPCLPSGPPALTLYLPLPFPPAPSRKPVVHQNEFLLSARIHDGFPITGASLIARSDSGTRTTSIFPSLVDAEPDENGVERIGPVRVNGILTVGDNEITLTATNCRGTTTSNVGNVAYEPLPPGTRFRQLGPVEVTQSVQTLNNGVPLIASPGDSVKRTFARVYLGVGGGPQEVTNVTGRLTAVRPDGSLPGGPVSIPSLNASDIAAGATLGDARKSLSGSLNFELPPEWLAAGELHLQLERLEIDGVRSMLPCDGCDNALPGAPQAPALVRFYATPPLRIYLVDMPYTPAPGQPPVTTPQAEIDGIVSFLRRTYPAAALQITQASLPTYPAPPGTCRQALIRLGFWAPAPGAHERTRYYGMLHDPNGTLVVTDGDGHPVGGCAERPGQLGWGFSGAEETAGHELGHMYGRKHVAGCDDPIDTDSSFPHAGGLIGSPALGDAQGLDAGDAALSLSLELNRWEGGVADIMSYCGTQWMSDYTYLKVLRTLCGGDLPNCPDHEALEAHTILGRRGASPPDAGSGAPPPAKKRGGGLRLSVSGTLAPKGGRARLGPLAALRGAALTDRPRKSAYAIVLRGAGGRGARSLPLRAEGCG